MGWLLSVSLGGLALEGKRRLLLLPSGITISENSSLVRFFRRHEHDLSLHDVDYISSPARSPRKSLPPLCFPAWQTLGALT